MVRGARRDSQLGEIALRPLTVILRQIASSGNPVYEFFEASALGLLVGEVAGMDFRI